MCSQAATYCVSFTFCVLQYHSAKNAAVVLKQLLDQLAKINQKQYW